jgi:hypothetical protein
MSRITLAAGVAAVLLALAPAVQAQEAMVLAHACGADIDRLCPGVPPGQGRIKACMKQHITQLSAPCFDAVLGAISAQKEPH